jgi:hypothetical protein
MFRGSAAEFRFCKRKVVQPSYVGLATSSTGGVWWIGFRVGLDDHRPISRSSVKPRDAGDCMMNESWQEPGGAEIHIQDQVDLRTATAVASGKPMCRRDQLNCNWQILRHRHLSH